MKEVRHTDVLSRALTLTLVVVCALVASACGGGSSSGDGDGPIKIGVILPTSGVYAQLGEDQFNAMKLYFEEQNNEINGREVELILEDEGTDPQESVQRARRLIQQEEVDVLTGAISSAVGLALVDVAEREQVPFIVSNAAADEITQQGSEYVFRTSYTLGQVASPFGRYLAEERGIETVVTAVPDYAGGRGIIPFLDESLTQNGSEIVEEVYSPLGTNDYSSYITRIGQSDPEGVVAFYAGTDSVRFVQQFENLQADVPLFGIAGLTASDSLPAMGEAALGIQSSFIYAATLDNPANEEFVEKYEAEYDDKVPSIFAMCAWDAAWLIGEALKATEGNTEDTDALIAAMEDVEFESPRGPLSLDENHNPVQNIYLIEPQELEDGRIENVVVETIAEDYGAPE